MYVISSAHKTRERKKHTLVLLSNLRYLFSVDMCSPTVRIYSFTRNAKMKRTSETVVRKSRAKPINIPKKHPWSRANLIQYSNYEPIISLHNFCTLQQNWIEKLGNRFIENMWHDKQNDRFSIQHFFLCRFVFVFQAFVVAKIQFYACNRNWTASLFFFSYAHISLYVINIIYVKISVSPTITRGFMGARGRIHTPFPLESQREKLYGKNGSLCGVFVRKMLFQVGEPEIH